jgi:hypothetical protein
VAVVDLIKAFAATGVNVLYSSELVPATLVAPQPDARLELLARLEAALLANGLVLQKTGERSYVVSRAPAERALHPLPAAPVRAEAPPETGVRAATLEEISVFSSRYEFTTAGSGEPLGYDQRTIEEMPGAEADTFRALRAAPGLATNLSARPYIRGAMLDDVLVQYDGIALADPYHFRNFQSVVSVFDPAAVSRADVFTGGFPVNYGTRSGGVIDLAPASVASGSEYAVGASFLSYNLETVGHADRLPLDWLLVARVSSDDSVLKRLLGESGEPNFYDVIGRLRWTVDSSFALTWGWLVQDDTVTFDSERPEDNAFGRSHDVTSWLSWDFTPNAGLKARTSLAVADTQRETHGNLVLPGIADGTLRAERSFTSITGRSDWVLNTDTLRWTFGGEFTRENADLAFDRDETFSPSIASAFGRPIDASAYSDQTPHSSTAGVYAAANRRWRAFEAEVGLRADGQDYQGFGVRGQVTPRVNLRYDFAEHWHGYASWGQFAQAQRVDEFRTEADQTTPDSATRATHVIAGTAYRGADSTTVRVEAYRHHWASISSYFDNALGSFSLLPQLQPDRVLVNPGDADAAGIEFSAQRSFGSGVTAWGSYTYSHVTDDSGNEEIVRSWDQPHAANLGIAWTKWRMEASAMLGWHTGWPRTPVSFFPAAGSAPAYLIIGERNSARWNDYLSLDARIATAIPLPLGELSVWLDGTNLTNRSNYCCTELKSLDSALGPPAMDATIWVPRMLNVGFTYRVRLPR